MPEPEERAPRPFPTQPLWLVVLAPLLTVPLTQSATQSLVQSDSCTVLDLGFMGGSASCQTGPLAMALAPGLLNLAALLWLFARDARTRRAALVAGVMGSVRLVLPLATLLSSGPTSTVGWGFSQAFPNDISVVFVSFFLWVASVVALIVVGMPGMLRIGRALQTAREDDQRRLS